MIHLRDLIPIICAYDSHLVNVGVSYDGFVSVLRFLMRNDCAKSRQIRGCDSC